MTCDPDEEAAYASVNKRGDDPAFPVPMGGCLGPWSGLTVREFLIAKAMEGLVASGAGSPDTIAVRSIMQADAVLAALDKEKPR